MKTAKKDVIAVRLEKATGDKLRYVAWYERTTLTDMITAYAELTIKQFEKSHGKITPEQLKEARIVE